jgi:hypothetical protein
MATKYKDEAEEIQKQAQEFDTATDRAEKKALRFDLGEGFLELGLVLSSLYFFGRQQLFPLFGGLSAIIGIVVALWAVTL